MPLSKLLPVLLLFTHYLLEAQTLSPNVIATSGTFAESQQGSLAWTIGEIAVETFSGPGYLTQGFHQPANSALVETGITVYPNPTSDFLFIKIPTQTKYSLELSNLHGQLLIEASVTTNGNLIYQLDIHKFSSAIYLLLVYNQETGKKSYFKIIKN